MTSFKELEIEGLTNNENKYYSPEEVNNLQYENYLSIMSHNICALNTSKFDEIQLFFNEIDKKKFTVVAVQEIRQIREVYEPTGYHKLVSKLRKKGKIRGGGV